MSKTRTRFQKPKALHIAGVSGSFSILQLKWENKFDE